MLAKTILKSQDIFNRLSPKRDVFYDLFYKLPEKVQNDVVKEYQKKYKKMMEEKTAYPTFNSETHKSDSGKYSVEISNVLNGWGYSRGVVSVGQDVICSVNRNYGVFPFKFIENHPNGHDYLICGEDYQGQTIIELDTGKRVDYLPTQALFGYGFCWADYKFHHESKILIVDGCYWACPYEYKFYDFSDPMNGLVELKMKEYVYADAGKWPEIDGKDIKCFDLFQDYEDEDEEVIKEAKVISIKTFRRSGDRLVVIDEWVEAKEAKRRTESRKKKVAYDLKIEKFKDNDPLYLAYKRWIEHSKLNPEKYETSGITHDKWCEHFKKEETRWCRRIVDRNGKNRYTIDLQWAIETGPIKLIIFKDGKHIDDLFFEHSVNGMNQAFNHAINLLPDISLNRIVRSIKKGIKNVEMAS